MDWTFSKSFFNMSVNNRLIPILQIDQRKLIKTMRFSPKRYLGDPLNAIRIFNLKEVSELLITDIGATQTGVIDFDFLKRLSAQAFVPLTYGGGISSLTDVHKLYQIGFDRILLGATAIKTPELINEIARVYGSQSIICSLDIDCGLFGYKLTYQGNTKCLSTFSLDKTIRNFIDCGAGEILFHDVCRDGTYQGLNYDLIRRVSKMSSVPVIECGVTRDIADAYQALSYGASAVAVGSLFSFYGKHKAVLINYEKSN